MKKQSITGAVLLLLAAAAAAAAILVSLCCTGQKTVTLTALPDPESTAAEFLDAICTRDYSTACGLLSGADTVGIETPPDDQYAYLLWETLTENISWAQVGECNVSGTDAMLQVLITTPDLPAALSDMDTEVSQRLADHASSDSSIIGTDGSYLQSAVLDTYEEVLQEHLSAEHLPFCSTQVTLQLHYSVGSGWKIIADSSLYTALSGGAA